MSPHALKPWLHGSHTHAQWLRWWLSGHLACPLNLSWKCQTNSHINLHKANPQNYVLKICLDFLYLSRRLCLSAHTRASVLYSFLKNTICPMATTWPSFWFQLLSLIESWDVSMKTRLSKTCLAYFLERRPCEKFIHIHVYIYIHIYIYIQSAYIYKCMYMCHTPNLILTCKRIAKTIKPGRGNYNRPYWYNVVQQYQQQAK